jgi:hypothetical protein
LVSVIAVITTIIIIITTTVAIIAVVVISSPLARLDLHRLALAARGAGVAKRHMACVVAAAEQNAWAASAAGYAKAIGVARSDLEHYADLQATLRPEKSTSGVLSLSFIGSVFYASLINDVDYMPNGLQHSSVSTQVRC